MALPKKKFRELTFQILFSYHFKDKVDESDIGFYMNQLKTTRKNVEEAFEFAQKVFDKKEELDEEIEKVSTSYDLTRIPGVEMNILRLCLYELRYSKDTPKEVVIHEGIRLSKKFSTTESLTFVNALLDQLYKNNPKEVYNP